MYDRTITGNEPVLGEMVDMVFTAVETLHATSLRGPTILRVGGFIPRIPWIWLGMITNASQTALGW